MSAYNRPNETPSMRDVYHSDFSREVRNIEQGLGDARWNASQSPLETGVVPKPAYADMFQPITTDPQPVQSGQRLPSSITTLSGETVNKTNFTHNNMTPFFGSRIRQNVDPEANFSQLDHFTGSGAVFQNKKEVMKNDVFQPTTGLTNICGMTVQQTDTRSRIAVPMARKNEFPIDQVQVGPGLGQGFTAEPSGGFHPFETQVTVKPKTVDELRVIGKERIVDEARSGPLMGTAQRGLVGAIEKNRPETSFCQGAEKFGAGSSAVSKETGRPSVELKDTTRPDTSGEYFAPAGPANSSMNDLRMTETILHETQQLPELPEGSVSLSRTGNDSEDYGKANVQVYSNERTITTTKTVTANITTAVKAAIAPLLDIFRHTKAEYLLDSARPMGELQAGATIPAKPTTYDPVDHQMKTTIKETTIHDGSIGNLKGPETGRDKNPTAMKTTGRNTLPLREEIRNIRSGTYKVTVYDPKQVAKTTMKETIERNKHNGSVDTVHPMGAYVYIEVDVPNTQKQFVSDNDYIGVPEKQAQDGYKVVQYTFVPHNTQKQFVSDNDYIGTAGNKDKKTVSTFMWGSLKDKTGKEILEVGRVPTASGTKNASGTESVSISSNRISEQIAAVREYGNVTRIAATGEFKNGLGENTKVRGLLTKQHDDRLDPSTLSALSGNPYHTGLVPIMA